MHIAIFGCGQLARMLALAGWPFGWRFSFVAEGNEPSQCVDGLGRIVRLNHHYSAGELFERMGKPDVITVEKESVDTELLTALQEYCTVAPSPEAIRICQNRRREKQFLRDLQLPTAPWLPATSLDEIDYAVKELGYPLIIKTDETGYDGKNQWRITHREALNRFKQNYARAEFTIEGYVRFQREVSLIAARSTSDDRVYYPLTDNHHVQGILRDSIAPAEDQDHTLQLQAEAMMKRLLEHLDYVGVLSMECFVTDQGLLINELAPRVHNSGHWTQQLGGASQFDNHLRAIVGQPLSRPPALQNHYGMVNILNPVSDEIMQNLVSTHSMVHIYNKTPKPWRKLGHINYHCSDRQSLIDAMITAQQILYGPSQTRNHNHHENRQALPMC